LSIVTPEEIWLSHGLRAVDPLKLTNQLVKALELAVFPTVFVPWTH